MPTNDDNNERDLARMTMAINDEQDLLIIHIECSCCPMAMETRMPLSHVPIIYAALGNLMERQGYEPPESVEPVNEFSLDDKAARAFIAKRRPQ